MKRSIICIVFVILMAAFCAIFSLATGVQSTESTGAEVDLPCTLVIHKIDAGTGLPVAEAEFILSNQEGSYLASSPEQSELRWNDSEEKAYTLVTDQDGVITVNGLLPGTYYLKEITAPEGYILLEEPIKVQILAQYGTDDNGNTAITMLTAQVNDGEPVSGMDSQPDRVEITVENTYDTVLPATGGIGTLVYYMLGFIVLFAFSLVIVAKRLIREQ